MKRSLFLDIYAVLLWISLPLIAVCLPDEMNYKQRQSLHNYLKEVFMKGKDKGKGKGGTGKKGC